MVATPHLDEGGQGLFVQPKEAVLDLYHVHLTAGHHHSNKGVVVCTQTLCTRECVCCVYECVLHVYLYPCASMCVRVWLCVCVGMWVCGCV